MSKPINFFPGLDRNRNIMESTDYSERRRAAIQATASDNATPEQRKFFSAHCEDIGFMPEVHEEISRYEQLRKLKEVKRLTTAAKAGHRALKAQRESIYQARFQVGGLKSGPRACPSAAPRRQQGTGQGPPGSARGAVLGRERADRLAPCKPSPFFLSEAENSEPVALDNGQGSRTPLAEVQNALSFKSV